MTKGCTHHKERRRRLIRRLLATLLIIVFLILLVVLIVWAILQPKKPRFLLQDATIYAFNISGTTFLTSNIQVTIIARNPNDRIGIYYSRLDVYAVYRSQQITYFTAIPSVYQGHKDVNVWSPFISGSNVPIAPFNGIALSQEAAAGNVPLMIRIDGRVRWRVGDVITGRYRLHVRCPAFIPFGDKSNTGIVVGNAMKYQLYQRCSVNV